MNLSYRILGVYISSLYVKVRKALSSSGDSIRTVFSDLLGRLISQIQGGC